MAGWSHRCYYISAVYFLERTLLNNEGKRYHFYFRKLVTLVDDFNNNNNYSLIPFQEKFKNMCGNYGYEK